MSFWSRRKTYVPTARAFTYIGGHPSMPRSPYERQLSRQMGSYWVGYCNGVQDALGGTVRQQNQWVQRDPEKWPRPGTGEDR